jgi:hypothetical protein
LGPADTRIESKPPRLSAGWWCALAVLVVNDHVLKGSGLLPGVVTGKLSDVAGLLVAPVLVAVALRLRTPRSKLVAVVLVVLAFGAIKLSLQAARFVEAGFAALGIPWRLWVDPTDLVALAVLPLTGWLLRAREDSRSRGALQRLGIVLGALSCLATSYQRFHGSRVLMNSTHDTLELAVYRSSVPIDCDAAETDAESSLPASAFVLERCATFGPYDMLSLDPPDVLERDDERECEAVVVAGAGLPPVAIFWSDPVIRSFERGRDGGEDYQLSVFRIGERLHVEPVPTVTLWQLHGELEPDDCGGAP